MVRISVTSCAYLKVVEINNKKVFKDIPKEGLKRINKYLLLKIYLQIEFLKMSLMEK